MIAFLSYFVKMLICSGVLYGYYALALKNNPFHRWNRGYILSATVASLLLPFLQFSLSAATVPVYNIRLITVVGYLPDNSQKAAAGAIGTWLPGAMYALVALVLLFNILRNWTRIKRLVRQGQKTAFDSYNVIKHPQVKSTFSFFNNIFWGEEIAPDSPEGRQVLQHELEHVNARHTADKLFMQIVCSVMWINPFFYLLRKELAMIHEFLADKAATAQDAPDDYARTLLQMTLQTKHMLLTNSFGQAPIKRRILMLFTDTAKYITLKKAVIFPLGLLLAFVIGCKQDLDLTTPVADTKVAFANKMGEVFTFVSDPPTFPGGEKELARYLASNIRYPKEAHARNITGTVFVNFVVASDGTVSAVKTVGAYKGGGLEEESIRVVSEMPKWNAGKQDGTPVSVAFNLPIKYVLQE